MLHMPRASTPDTPRTSTTTWCEEDTGKVCSVWLATLSLPRVPRPLILEPYTLLALVCLLMADKAPQAFT